VKKRILFLAVASIAPQAYAQASKPLQTNNISLDTVAVSGRVRQLSLLPPGEKPSTLGGFSVSPGHRIAVWYQPPASEHEYDIRSVTLHFNTLFNASSAGSLLVQLALADSSGAPSATYLLPNPFLITNKQVRRASHRAITLSVQGNELRLAKTGIFVVLIGAPDATDRFITDTVITAKRGKYQRLAYVKVQDIRNGVYRLISNADFLTLPVAYTTAPTMTWSFWQRDQQWRRVPSALPNAPHYRPYNYWIELGVTER
jgi:hypothetical protein